MLTRSYSLHCGATDQLSSFYFFRSGPVARQHNHGDGSGQRIKLPRSGQAYCSSSGSRKSRASLAYMRTLSRKGLKAADPSNPDMSLRRAVTDEATVDRLHVIPYSELVLRRKVDGGLSLIEASEMGSESEYCWEDAWKLYMQSQSVTLKELAVRMQECNPQIDDTVAESLPSGAPLPIFYNSSGERAGDRAPARDETLEVAHEKQPSFLSNLRVEKLGRRRTRGLMLLNVLAALYGSSTVAGKFATDVSPGLPASLSTLVRFFSALLVFLPALRNVLGRDKNPALLKAGTELGGLLFAAAVLETCGNGGASGEAPLLFAFTVIFVPIMELCAGRQSIRNITRIASLVALSGMGVLEGEWLGWKGISAPQVGDVWGLAASAIYALHIFRSEAHSKSFRPFELTAVQCGTVASLSLVWELFRVLHENTTAMEYVSQLQSLPWGPLVYTGLVCSGLCSWLEIHGLRSVQASTATMVNTTIPIWGAFLSFFLRGDTLDDSAIVGGLVILVASLFAQLVSKQDETVVPPRPQQSSASEDKELRPQPPVEAPVLTAGESPASPSNTQPQKLQPSSKASKPGADHVQGAIITSQLKFPFYAAQAKRLLVEAKLKILSMKSLVMAATSTLLTTPSPVPPDSLHSAAPGAIATSVTLQQAASTVSNGASNSSLQLPGKEVPAALAAQWLDIATGILESAITALGSDIVQAAEEAENIAKLLEQAAQTAIDQVAMAGTSATSLVDMANWTSIEIVKSFDITATTVLVDNSVDCALPLIVHHADTVLQVLLICSSNPN